MKIAHVASEVAPWSQTGGLADVVGALPNAERVPGPEPTDAVVFSPLYRCVRERAREISATLTDTGLAVEVALGGAHFRAHVVKGESPLSPLPIHFIDVPELFDREGIYTAPDGAEFPDNAVRFATLCRAAVAAAPSVFGGRTDVLHAHDWQAGLAPLYAKSAGQDNPAAVFTIHNLAYQGVFPKSSIPSLGLQWSLFTPDRLEFYDQISLLKAGVFSSDVVTTVSPTYAAEITTPEFGCHLDGYLQHNAPGLRGIVNGIDVTSWNPATDPCLDTPYDADNLTGKAACRRALAQELGIEINHRTLLVGVVSRFAEQKGLDLVADLAPDLAELGAQVVVLGTGDRHLEDRFFWLSAQPGSHLHARIGFDRALARRIYAGCDALLMPSRFEPCGLNQLYAMRYGTVPIVHAVGGLRDTVLDPGDDALASGDGTGFRFEHADVGGLRWALERACTLFHKRPDGWRNLVLAGMGRDVSWTASAASYLALYRELLADRVHSGP